MGNTAATLGEELEQVCLALEEAEAEGVREGVLVVEQEGVQVLDRLGGTVVFDENAKATLGTKVYGLEKFITQ